MFGVWVAKDVSKNATFEEAEKSKSLHMTADISKLFAQISISSDSSSSST